MNHHNGPDNPGAIRGDAAGRNAGRCANIRSIGRLFSLISLVEQLDDGCAAGALPQKSAEHILLKVAEHDVHGL
jgi:hypothetical protein